MKIVDTPIADLYVIEPTVWRDERGYFMETYNERIFGEHDLVYEWVQDNEARSALGATRGLHYQVGPYAQAKLVRVVTGSVLDVAVDIRRDSPTYGRYYTIELNDTNKRQLLIPRGFAHGYQVLEDNTVFAYKCDNLYSKQHEGGISPEDEFLSIPWPLPRSKWKMSEKDKALPFFQKHISI